MKEFLLENWKFCFEVLLLIVLVIITLLKKCKLITKDTALEQVIVKLPTIISAVEDKGLTGENKKSLVLSYALKMLTDLTGLTSFRVREKYLDVIDHQVENILSTPQKKEVLIDEKDNV